MLKKLAAAFIGAACLVIPIATAGSAGAASPVYHHTIAGIGHQHVFWDRNWPSANREIDKNYDDVRSFASNSAGTGVTPRFNTTTRSAV